jgi:glutamate 5-kinase
MHDPTSSRARLAAAKRIVIKFGTRTLVGEDGRPNARHIAALVRELAAWHARGKEIIVVSSGAIGAGIEALGWKTRPRALPELQLAAAVGQARLMARYSQLFARAGITTGQVLLTHDDLKHRTRHLNARNTLLTLLRHRVLPIVNENDVVSVDEIKVGDNDQLAAMVAILADAELLLLMTSVEGLLDASGQRVPHLARVSEEARGWAVGKGSALSTGGMSTKLWAAHKATLAGAAVVIADGRDPRSIRRVLQGEDAGTLVEPRGRPGAASLLKRKLWIAFFHKPRGKLVVDAGAREAILVKGRSLLPIGVREVEGLFQPGDVVQIADPEGRIFAHGLSEFSSQQALDLRGCKSEEVARRLPGGAEIVHRDNLALLNP